MLLQSGFGLEAVAAESLFVRVLYGGAVVAAVVIWSGIANPWRTLMRIMTPLIYCASTVYVLGRVFPEPHWGAAFTSMGLYAIAMIPVLPLLWSEMRRACRQSSFRVPK